MKLQKVLSLVLIALSLGFLGGYKLAVSQVSEPRFIETTPDAFLSPRSKTVASDGNYQIELTPSAVPSAAGSIQEEAERGNPVFVLVRSDKGDLLMKVIGIENHSKLTVQPISKDFDSIFPLVF